MPRNKFLVLLAGALLLCALTFTGFSAPPAFAASATTATHNMVAAPAYTCPLPVVGYGYTESGSAVLLAQQSLNSKYNNNSTFRGWVNYTFPGDFPIAQDSSFGNQTWNAAWDFQYWDNLSADGIIGSQTWHALGHC